MDKISIRMLRLRKSRFLQRTELNQNVDNIFDYIKTNKISGDYAEFGVWEGLSFMTSFMTAQDQNLINMHFHAFDSFEGLPSVTSIYDEGGLYKEKDYFCSRKKFEKNLKIAGVDLRKVIVHSGFFDDVIPNTVPFKIAIAWVDCDLYSSTKDVLAFVKNNVVDGGILYFDDWFAYKGGDTFGERKAFFEVFNECEYQDFPVSGIRKAFIIRNGRGDDL